MTAQSGSGSQDMVVGYFSDGADAYRAINELIDEGFTASEIGAAFRTRRAGAGGEAEAAVGEMKGVRELTETNPALSGSVGGGTGAGIWKHLRRRSLHAGADSWGGDSLDSAA